MKGKRTFSVLLTSRGKDERDWVDTVPVVQACLNKAMPVSSRDGKTPLELITGITPKTGVDFVAWMGVEAKVGRITQDEMTQHFTQV